MRVELFQRTFACGEADFRCRLLPARLGNSDTELLVNRTRCRHAIDRTNDRPHELSTGNFRSHGTRLFRQIGGVRDEFVMPGTYFFGGHSRNLMLALAS